MTRRGIRRRYNPGSPVPGQRMDSAVQPAVAPPPGLDAILELAREDMASVDALIRRRLASDVVLVNQGPGAVTVRPREPAGAGR